MRSTSTHPLIFATGGQDSSDSDLVRQLGAHPIAQAMIGFIIVELSAVCRTNAPVAFGPLSHPNPKPGPGLYNGARNRLLAPRPMSRQRGGERNLSIHSVEFWELRAILAYSRVGSWTSGACYSRPMEVRRPVVRIGGWCFTLPPRAVSRSVAIAQGIGVYGVSQLNKKFDRS